MRFPNRYIPSASVAVVPTGFISRLRSCTRISGTPGSPLSRVPFRFVSFQTMPPMEPFFTTCVGVGVRVGVAAVGPGVGHDGGQNGFGGFGGFGVGAGGVTVALSFTTQASVSAAASCPVVKTPAKTYSFSAVSRTAFARSARAPP